MDESKRRFIKQSVGVLTASGLVAGVAKHAEATDPPDVPLLDEGPRGRDGGVRHPREV